MNILQEIDSVLYYENLEKAWKKYRFVILGLLISIFAGIAAFNHYHKNKIETSAKDSDIILNLLMKKAEDGYIDRLKQALQDVNTKQAKEIITLELAKEEQIKGNYKIFEQHIQSLLTAENDVARNISIYMLAQYYAYKNQEEALNFINSIKQDKTAFNYALVQELKATALIALDKKDEAKTVLDELSKNQNLSTSLEQRIKIKLEQLH